MLFVRNTKFIYIDCYPLRRFLKFILPFRFCTKTYVVFSVVLNCDKIIIGQTFKSGPLKVCVYTYLKFLRYVYTQTCFIWEWLFLDYPICPITGKLDGPIKFGLLEHQSIIHNTLKQIICKRQTLDLKVEKVLLPVSLNTWSLNIITLFNFMYLKE